MHIMIWNFRYYIFTYTICTIKGNFYNKLITPKIWSTLQRQREQERQRQQERERQRQRQIEMRTIQGQY